MCTLKPPFDYSIDMDDEGSSETLLEWLGDQEQVDVLSEAMSFEEVPEERGVVDSVSIDEVNVIDNNISIQYSYDWSAYYGCDDINSAGREDGLVIEGLITDMGFEFSAATRPEPRSPYEEF